MAYGQIKEQCTLTSVFYENYSLDDTYSADEDFDYSLVEENDVIIEHIDDIVDYLDSHVRTRHRDRSSSSNSRSYSSTIIKLLTSSQKLLQQQCKHRQNPPKTQTRKFNQRAKRQIRSLKTNDLSKLFQCDYDLKQEQELEEEKLRLNAEKKEKDDEIVPEKETIIRETTAIAVKSELEIKKRKQKYHKHHRRPPLRSLSAPSPETKKQPDTLKPEQSASFMAFRRYFYYHYRETIQTSLTFSRDGITIKNVRLVPPSEKRYSTQEKFMKFLNKNHDAQDNRKIPDLVFHGTHMNNMQSIINYGLLVPNRKYSDDRPTIAVKNGSAYGVGIYTSTSAQYSTAYTKGTNTMLVCAAITHLPSVSSSKTTISKQKEVQQCGHIVVIRHEARILPLFLIDFHRSCNQSGSINRSIFHCESSKTITSGVRQTKLAQLQLMKRRIETNPFRQIPKRHLRKLLAHKNTIRLQLRQYQKQIIS